MKPKLMLIIFYSILLALGAAWHFTGQGMKDILFYLLFLSGFLFNAYCGYLELKSGSRNE